MADVDSDAYWIEEFAITKADLGRLAGFIMEQSQAQDLSLLIKRVVRGRLRHGHDTGSAAVTTIDGDSSSTVRLWDPAGDWQPGDHAIVIRQPQRHNFLAFIGEVIAVTTVKVEFYLPDENEFVPFERAEIGSKKARKWHTKVLEVVEQKRAAEGEAESVEVIILEYGERLAGLLLQALREDKRFVLLDGRYFLQSLARPASEFALDELAWLLLQESVPLPTIDLLDRIPNADGDEALFGLYLALRQHSEWFTNTQPGRRPLWALAGPPPGSFTPQYSAYDPDSYELLCLPDVEAAPNVVTRLWKTELLTAVV